MIEHNNTVYAERIINEFQVWAYEKRKKEETWG